jgi:hypothetical protein
MNRLKLIFYFIYLAYCLALLFLCFKLLQIPDATEDAFYLYLKETFGGYFGVIAFLEKYFRSFQIFTVFAVIFSFSILVSDYLGSLMLRRKVAKLELEINALKAKLYDKAENSKGSLPGTDLSSPSKAK